MSVIVRKAVRTDDKGIFEVERDSFSIPWSLQAVQRELESERALYYVLEQEDGTIVGYAGLWQVLDEGQITNIALRKEFRHQGYGELLVRVLMEAAWEAGCTEIFGSAHFQSGSHSLISKIGLRGIKCTKALLFRPRRRCLCYGL